MGIAPFTFTGIERKVSSISSTPAATNPGGICQFCGTSIVDCYWIKDTNDKRFYVGIECVRKTGDPGLYDSVKKARAVKRLSARADNLREQRIEATGILSDPDVTAALSAEPHPNEYLASIGKTRLDYLAFMIEHVHSEVAPVLKTLRKMAAAQKGWATRRARVQESTRRSLT